MQTLKQLQSGALKGSVSLKLSEGLTHFPREIFDLADTLEVLELTGNQLSELPADFGRLKKLRIFFCSNNRFAVLPTVLADCTQLDMVGFKANHIETIPSLSLPPNIRWLILTDNRIAELPKEIGRCTRMQKLMLAGNRLTSLPAELALCSNLTLLRISANRLTELPQWLLAMPRLSWLAFSGNLFGTGAVATPVPLIPWHALVVGGVLGEGASGIIYKAVMNDHAVQKEVAVKLFKGAVTSDGLPDDEMNAFVAAGPHSGLATLIGQIIGHPGRKVGLVMELIPPSFRPLGLAPDFVTCTRDVFLDGARIPVANALKIATTIASVACQLHSKGIMHGDLYAHNTLTDDEGNALLSDFGAASRYEPNDATVAYALERLEVSAFGHLLDDLLFLCGGNGGYNIIAVLSTLRDACLAPIVSSRPGFLEVSAQLAQLAERNISAL